MKRNNTNSGTLGIHALTSRAFTVANPGASYVPISASFTPSAISVTAQGGNASYYGEWVYNIYIGSGVLPAWMRPGTPIQLNASTTISGRSYNISDDYVVTSVDSSGTFFTVLAPRPSGGKDAAALNQALTKQNLDSGAGAVKSPSVNLILQCQKVLFQAISGSVTVASSVDANGNAPVSYPQSVGVTFERTAPTGAKFDLADWYVTGTGTLGVDFM